MILATAKVGGIRANDEHPADFIRINLQIQTNVIDAAYRHGAQKLLFLGNRGGRRLPATAGRRPP